MCRTQRQISGELLWSGPLYKQLHCNYFYQGAENSPYPHERLKALKEETASVIRETSG